MEDKYIPRIKNFWVNWASIKDACMSTIGKESEKIPADEWKRKLMLCEHSPLRRSCITLKWDNIPFYVMGHFVRHHVGCTPFVSTSRSDRTGVDRSERKQTDMVSMEMDFNIQSLIDVSRKRLCNCADAETIKYWTGAWIAIYREDPIIAEYMVPECIRRCGCPESFGGCKFFEWFAAQLTKEELIDIRTRLAKYNEIRVKKYIK